MPIDFFGYLNITCAIIGAVLFVISISVVLKIFNLLPKAKIRTDWKIIIILIVFFLFGYALNIFMVISGMSEMILVMQAFVYAFGALFVLIVVRLSYKTYKILVEAAEPSKE